MTGISWMLQEVADCPPAQYGEYEDEEGGSEMEEEVEYEYSYEVSRDQ